MLFSDFKRFSTHILPCNNITLNANKVAVKFLEGTGFKQTVSGGTLVRACR